MLALIEDSATVDLGRCSTPTNLWDVPVKNVPVAHFRGGAVDGTTKKFVPDPSFPQRTDRDPRLPLLPHGDDLRDASNKRRQPGPSRHRRCLDETLMRCVASKQMLPASSSTEGQNAGNIRFSAASVKCANGLSAPIVINRDRILTDIATVCLMSGAPALVRD
jgi:hypothetical protein